MASTWRLHGIKIKIKINFVSHLSPPSLSSAASEMERVTGKWDGGAAGARREQQDKGSRERAEVRKPHRGLLSSLPSAASPHAPLCRRLILVLAFLASPLPPLLPPHQHPPSYAPPLPPHPCPRLLRTHGHLLSSLPAATSFPHSPPQASSPPSPPPRSCIQSVMAWKPSWLALSRPRTARKWHTTFPPAPLSHCLIPALASSGLAATSSPLSLPPQLSI